VEPLSLYLLVLQGLIYLHRGLMLRLAHLQGQGPAEMRKGYKNTRGMFRKATTIVFVLAAGNEVTS
jgi:hypothetical protein